MSYMSLSAYEVSGSTSIANNTSRLYVKLTITTTGSSWNESGDTTGSITINGTSYSLNGKRFGYQTTTTLYEDTFTITHNTDGSKKVTVSYSFNTQISLGTLTGSKDVTLTTIPRATDISCTGGTIGSSATITLSRKSTSYYHKLYYKMSGQSSNTLIASGVAASSYSWSIPTSFYALIPNATKLTGTLYCYTYSNSACTSQIGDYQTCSVTVSTSENACKPVVSLTLTTDSNTRSKTGNTTTIIKNYSTVTAASSVSARNSASINSYNVVSGGVTKSNTASATFDKVTSGNFVLTATDSRGYTNSETKTLNVVEYINPDISFLEEPVLDIDGKLTIKIKGSAFNGSFGSVSNTIACKYYYKESGSSGYINGNFTLTKSGNTYSATKTITGLAYNKTYNVYCSVSDTLNSAIQTEVKAISSIPVFDWGKDDFAFHVPVNVDGDLNIRSGAIELNRSGSLDNFGGYIDFHFNKSNEDYTSRIIEDSSGHINIQTPNGLSIAGDITFDKGEQTSERDIYFGNKNGGHSHNCSLYGGNPNSSTGIGLWDNKNGRAVLYYEDDNNKLILGNDAGVIKSERRLGYLSYSGGLYMNASQSVELWGKISEQPCGIVIAWSYYSSSSGTGQNYDWNYTFIPKEHVLRYSGTGIDCPLIMYANGTLKVTEKYLYVTDTTLTGNDVNSTGDAKLFVLRAVYGV